MIDLLLSPLVISGALVALAIWVFQRETWSKWIRFASFAVVVVALAASLYVFSAGTNTLGPTGKWYDGSPEREIILFVMMLLGMAARYLTRAIEVRRDRIAVLQKANKPFQKPGLEFDAWEFAYPFIVSVITYGALLSQTKDSALSVASLTLSFQTGFFWQTIIAAKQTHKN
jgi:hypothetical protein